MDAYLIDKARVRAAFGRAAAQYDGAAVVQAQVREEMASRLALIKMQPSTILDAGCGTGLGSQLLQKYYPKAQITSLDFAFGMLKQTQQAQIQSQTWWQKITKPANVLCADIEQLPLKDSAINFVWSNLAMQWCNDLDQALAEFYRVLQPEGLLMFSTFGPDTLKELRHASQTTHTHVSRFIDMHDIGDALVRAGFDTPVLDVETYTLTYENVQSVMRDLKTIGAQNATAGRARGLSGKGFLQELTARYEQFRQQGRLPATFEVVFAHAWKGQPKDQAQTDYAPIHFKPRSNQNR